MKHTSIVPKIKLLIKQRRLTDCLELLQRKGLTDEIAVFAIAYFQDLGLAE